MSESFYIWETYPLTITVSDADAQHGDPSPLVDVDSVVVSFRQGTKSVHLSGNRLSLDASDGTIGLELSQAETGKFVQGTVDVQVNLLYEDSERDTTAMGVLEARDNLYKKVMDHAEP